MNVLPTEDLPAAADRHAPKGRLLGIDAVRALAIIGVFVVHFFPSGWLHAAPPAAADDVLAWLNVQLSSRAMSLFVLLAGVSVALMTGGSKPHQGVRMSRARRRVAVRAAVLFVLSLCIDELGPSVISYYAVLLLLLIPLTRLRARTLFTLAGIATPVVTGYAWWVMSAHPDWMRGDSPNGLAVFTHPGQWGDYLVQLVFTGGGFQTVYGIPLVLAGLAIGRLDLHEHTVRLRMLGAGLAVAATSYTAYALVWHGLGLAKDAAPGPAGLPWQALFGMPTDIVYATSPLGIVFMIGIAMALLGGMLLAFEHRPVRVVLWPLAAAGGMAMTWYAAHFGYLNLLGEAQTVSAVHLAAIVAAMLAASALWRHWFRRGPLEWLVHRAITTAVPRT